MYVILSYKHNTYTQLVIFLYMTLYYKIHIIRIAQILYYFYTIMYFVNLIWTTHNSNMDLYENDIYQYLM
jgi:hypothetical protein